MELKLLLLPLINFIVWFKLYLYGIEMNEELSVQALPKSSNCTFMELKFERVQALKKKLGFKLYLYGIEIRV